MGFISPQTGFISNKHEAISWRLLTNQCCQDKLTYAIFKLFYFPWCPDELLALDQLFLCSLIPRDLSRARLKSSRNKLETFL